MKTPHTKVDFDLAAAAGCEVPGCTHKDHDELFLHPKCHPGAGIQVSYKRGAGFMRLCCNRCKRHIVDVLLADPLSPPRSATEAPHGT